MYMDVDQMLAKLSKRAARAILQDCEITPPADADKAMLQHMVVSVVPRGNLESVLAQWVGKGKKRRR